MIFLVNRLRFDRMTAMSLWPHFLAHPVEYRAYFTWKVSRLPKRVLMRSTAAEDVLCVLQVQE